MEVLRYTNNFKFIGNIIDNFEAKCDQSVRENIDYSYMNSFIVSMSNRIFLEKRKTSPFQKCSKLTSTANI